MAKKLPPIEKLAREICWAGFSDPKHAGCTKKQYWERIPGSVKATYVLEADRLARLLPRIDPDVLNELALHPQQRQELK